MPDKTEVLELVHDESGLRCSVDTALCRREGGADAFLQLAQAGTEGIAGRARSRRAGSRAARGGRGQSTAAREIGGSLANAWLSSNPCRPPIPGGCTIEDWPVIGKSARAKSGGTSPSRFRPPSTIKPP